MGACNFTIQRRFPGVGVLALALLTAACGSVQSAERSDDPTAKLLANAEKAADSVVSDIAEALGAPTAKKEEAPSTAARTADKPAVPVRRPRPVQARPAPVAVEAAPVAAVAPERVALATPVVEEAAPEPAIVKALDYTVYSASDTDVIPPTPPVVSGLRPWRLKAGPSVEVIVASDGSVEKVQVLGKTRMSDTQVLSHVKAWKFAPALRAGDPVRYRLLLEDPVMAP